MLSLSHLYPGSGVVLDCINSWSLPTFLLISRTQHSDADEAKTRGPLVSSQALYHWATVLPLFLLSKGIMIRSSHPHKLDQEDIQ